MTNTEIYIKALRKIENNPKGELFIPRLIVDREELYDYEIYYIIFSHEFCKAFWGEKAEETYIMRYSDKVLNDNKIPRWKYYLQQMVLEPEPLKYLEKFL